MILNITRASAEEGYSVGFYCRQEESSYNWEAQFCWKLEEQKQKHEKVQLTIHQQAFVSYQEIFKAN